MNNFENVMDRIYNETLSSLQKSQREATNLVNSPIEIFKDIIEDMAFRRKKSISLKIENEILTFREVLEQIRAFIIDEEGYLKFNYS